MFDIHAIRENPDYFKDGWEKRGLEREIVDEILTLDKEYRAALSETESQQAQLKQESAKIHELKKAGESPAEQIKVVHELKEVQSKVFALANELVLKRDGILAGIPNIMADDVPDGESEDDNVEICKWGVIKSQSGPDHVEIGEALGMIDFETAAKMSGARFTLLTGGIARLERALAQFFLDTHTSEHGFTEVSPPLLVRDNALFGTGQLPKFAEDQFSTKETDHFLIPTSEVPLTNIVADSILDEGDLNKRFTAFTPCFRSEAGSAGKDTRGMLRQHQFYKVEMVSITKPEDSAAEHEFMTECAENVLKKLELPFRTVVLCAGDTGFGATKTHDIEVWLPGQETYREISSVSNCGDFQARRMKARFKRSGEKRSEFVHTLNGSGVAVGRALIAVIENYYDPADGGVFVPDALKPYMGGVEKIVK